MSRNDGRPTFSYNVLALTRDVSDPWQVEAELNKLGKDGWELVSVADGLYYFRRLVLARERGRLGVV